MAGLSGIASGVDTDAIVSKLVEAEAGKRLRMDWTQAQINSRSTGLAGVQTKLIALRTASQGLRDIGTWTDTQTVESSDAKVGLRRTAGAAAGGYSVEVLGLARAEQRVYDYTPPGSGSTLDVGSFSVTLTAGATLADAVSRINGATGSPVYASAVDGRLVLSARATGASSSFTATGGAIAEDASRARAGQDASFRIDGGAVQTSATNVVADGLPGVEFTLKGITASPVSIVVGSPGVDKAVVKAKVEAFVTAYNDVVTTTRALTGEARVPTAKTATDFAKGSLRADSGLNTMLAQLRAATSTAVSGNASVLDELRELGVSTGAPSAVSSADSRAGLLTLTAAKLTAALDDPQAVRRLLGGVSGVDGFAQRIEGVLSTQVGASGVLAKRIGEAARATTDLQDRMTREDTRLAGIESRYKARFAAMETALAQAQTQGTWLSGQLAALA